MRKFLGFVSTKHESKDKTMAVYDLAALFYSKTLNSSIELISVLQGTPPGIVAAQLRDLADKIDKGNKNEQTE